MLKSASVVMVVLAVAFPTPGAGRKLADITHLATYVDLFRMTGLGNVMDGNDTFHTVFLPWYSYLNDFLHRHNMTMNGLHNDTAGLKALLQYHVVPGHISPDQLFNERKLTALDGGTIRINHYYDGHVNIYLAQGVSLRIQETITDNGAWYALSGVLTKPESNAFELITSNCTRFASAIHSAGLKDFLQDQEPITVFAPSDAAFEALGSKVEFLTENPSLLADVIKYHIIPGTVHFKSFDTASRKYTNTFATFMDGQSHTVEIEHWSGVGTVDGNAFLPTAAASVTNGVVQFVDTVLLPDSVENQL